ncbi:MAG: ThuA domain-containing protein [Phycisphaerales bacterium]|nr:ThuA domain-containing protein [Phycisphaerales bacterium]
MPSISPLVVAFALVAAGTALGPWLAPLAPLVPATAPSGPAVDRDAAPIRVVYCTHSAGYRHEVLPESRAIMSKLGETHDWLEVFVTDDVSDLTPSRLDETDVLMLYTSGTLPMTGEQKEALQSFVARGGGIVGVHSASDTFHDWDWFVRTIGGEFDGHPWHERVGLLVKDTTHPATAHLGSRFEIVDEIYQFKRLNDDRDTLIELDTSSVDHDVVPGRAYPTAWTLRFGDGRVFYTALGHRPEVWRDQRFVDHVLGGIRWAAGREGPMPAAPATPAPTDSPAPAAPRN